MALASGTSVPFGPPFVTKCISLAQCSIVYFCHCVSHLDTIKDYVMLCYVMLCYVYSSSHFDGVVQSGTYSQNKLGVWISAWGFELRGFIIDLGRIFVYF